MPASDLIVQSLWRHPVKGFSPERLENVQLTAGECFPNDRMFAIEDGPSGFDPSDPKHISKMRFVVLARSARVANFETIYVDERKELEIYERDEDCICSFDMSSQDGFDDLSDWLTNRFEDEFKGPLKVIPAPNKHRFMDYNEGFVSLINASSVQALSDAIGAEVSPSRFRGNVLFEGAAWIEDEWKEGQRIKIGDAVLEILIPTVRCKATHANPKSAQYDLDIVPALMRHFRRKTMGVYAKVIQSGRLKVSSKISVL